jgi:hypothetical protein
VTKAPKVRAGSGGSNKGSIRTEPVKVSAGPFTEGRELLRLISIVSSFGLFVGSMMPVISNLGGIGPCD